MTFVKRKAADRCNALGNRQLFNAFIFLEGVAADLSDGNSRPDISRNGKLGFVAGVLCDLCGAVIQNDEGVVAVGVGLRFGSDCLRLRSGHSFFRFRSKCRHRQSGRQQERRKQDG